MSTAEKRAELLRVEVEESWPLMKGDPELGTWNSEEEIREYYSPEKMTDKEVLHMWSESPMGQEVQHEPTA